MKNEKKKKKIWLKISELMRFTRKILICDPGTIRSQIYKQPELQRWSGVFSNSQRSGRTEDVIVLDEKGKKKKQEWRYLLEK